MTRRIHTLLRDLYETDAAHSLAERIQRRLASIPARTSRRDLWSESDVLLITYADSIRSDGQSPLASLHTFLTTWVPNLISQVHLLPFFPFTSDDGFAVSDYRAIAAHNGTWEDIERLSQSFELVFDYVINHGSSAHPHFQEFLEDRAPGNQYFFTAEPETDVSGVTRPRATPLLQAYETARGTRYVWCTFSRDQVDWDFSNPDVLYEFVDIFLTYIERGASWLRIDAIAYLWKQLGTPCVHLPQTHAVVKLLRAIADQVSPSIKLLTETNVPLAENLSYFGDGDEAHIVYNFSLPPLLTHGLLTGDSTHLTRWCASLPTLRSGCTYLNFTASHDGIGLRPAEGILSDAELAQLVDCVSAFGGRLTQRTRPDGSLSPYEANIALFDLLKGTVDGLDAWQIERFLVSQSVMMAMQGVPALYYNSLLAAPNNVEGMEETGRNRTINRRKWEMTEIEARLDAPESAARRVLEGLKEMLRVRRSQPAFHPEVPQRCLVGDPRLFILIREASDGRQTLACLFNLSQEDVSIPAKGLKPAAPASESVIYAVRAALRDDMGVTLGPYGTLWFELSEAPQGVDPL